jgi:hypothetical protein
MKHLAAYLLLALAGNTSPSSEDVKAVLSSVGIDADEERLNKLIAELEGKDLQEVSNYSSKITDWEFWTGADIELYNSSLPRVPPSSLPFPPVVLPPLLLPLPVPLPVVLLLLPLRRRRRRRRRSPTRTWASVFSTKRVDIYKRSKIHEVWWGSRNLAVIFSMGSKLAHWYRSACVHSGFSDAVTRCI